MNQQSKADEYIQSLNTSQRLGSQIVFQKTLPAIEPSWAVPQKPWPDTLQELLPKMGIARLYSHQATAIDYIRSGRHIIVATPTASGKTLVYNLPVLEKIIADVHSNALYIFPLKALAQDQLKNFRQMAAHCPQPEPSSEIYDGDTSAWHRKRIREAPPNVLLTNPEMLHLSLLAHHPKWSEFLSHLDTIVVDEVHTYRGILGSHVAQIFRRLRRICEHYGSSPTYIFSSATVAGPGQLAEQLSGFEVATLERSGAPRAKRHLVFIDPLASPAQAAILLLKTALARGLRTIVYTQSRKLAELISIWAGSRSGEFADKISAYRAGLLASERRKIESRLACGDLLAVISTSALELGIDIGDLDLCLLVGYPGSMVSTWQRGGRVGRSGQDSAIILIAAEDALDQYFLRNPQEFITREPETAVVNPFNPEISAQHIVCAATELPLRDGESFALPAPIRKCIAELEKNGKLLRSADGKRIFSTRKAPHRDINLRGAGKRLAIISSGSREPRGEIDAFRACRETHPGAVYLHRGDTYIVDRLDLPASTVHVSRARVNYYTRVRASKSTEILEIDQKRSVNDVQTCFGKIRVTDHVTEYEIWDIESRTLRDRIPLDLPPQIFETESLWFQVSPSIHSEIETRHLDFMGGLHAAEHAAIGVFPLLVMADRNDIGGLSTLYHNQVNAAAIFIYDGIPGGAGMARQAFDHTEQLFECALATILQCACESGCPSCIHSPKCGNGNRPMDKLAARTILEQMLIPTPPRISTIALNEKSGEDDPVPRTDPGENPRAKSNSPTARKIKEPYYGVFDLETQRSAAEVGGWHRADKMGISCAVVFDSRKQTYLNFLEDQVDEFLDALIQFDVVIGFNIKRFDYLVLSGYTDLDFSQIHTLDILEDIYNHLGFRLSLAHLAEVTLNSRKSADGLQALKWWQQGQIDKILEYCRQDVRITHELFLYGQQRGYILFRNKSEEIVRIPVSW
jgi:DEAD/DEAH box helicase domain-containing protein